MICKELAACLVLACQAGGVATNRRVGARPLQSPPGPESVQRVGVLSVDLHNLASLRLQLDARPIRDPFLDNSRAGSGETEVGSSSERSPERVGTSSGRESPARREETCAGFAW
jgi:hypothetical protein